ncbi:MAG: hypothetical protein HY241_16565 [Actinobacteria bacterium]|nr:hypothetical protein [Actinomycetota bacterium]
MRDTHPDGDLRALRARWRQVRGSQQAPQLTVGVLASYTADPLVPYLGMALHRAGLAASVEVGPANQITQQCLDDSGGFARSRPDVLVVAPRLTELGPVSARRGWVEELVGVVEAASAAARWWGSCLLVVLPEIPDRRPEGVGDAADPGGVVAAATAAREAVRQLLAGRPNVLVADAEEAVRRVGLARAFHPAMFRYARVPYTEELYARLGDQLGRIIALRHARRHRVVVLDGDALLAVDVSPDRTGAAGTQALDAVTALREPLLQLHAAGLRVALRGSPGRVALGPLVTAFPELLRDLAPGWAVDRRPARDQVRALAADADELAGAVAVITTDPLLADDLGSRQHDARTVVLAGEPEEWPAQLLASGLFDRLPDPDAGDPDAGARPLAPGRPPPVTAATGPAAAMSLADYVAGLDVRLEIRPAPVDRLADIAELVARAKDFTLGRPSDLTDLAAGLDGLLAVTIRDRLADYGLGAAVRMRLLDGAVGVVDLFSVSCPVLAKGVEAAVLAELVGRAGRAGCDRLTVTARDTGVNGSALRFLGEAAGRDWSAVAGRPLRLDVTIERG